MSKTIIFLIGFILPFVYWRTMYFFAKKNFDRPFTRSQTKLQVHHLHYGAFFALVAAVWLLLAPANLWAIGLLALGLGLIFDEFIPSLIMPTERPVELAAYERGLKPTIILFLVIAVTLLIIELL